MAQKYDSLRNFAKERPRNKNGSFAPIPKPPAVTDTFSGGTWGRQHKVLPNSSDALRDNPENVRRMGDKDPAVTSALDQRYHGTAGLDWTIDPPDPNDPKQQEVSEELFAIIEKIPQLRELFLTLLDGIWVGKSAATIDWRIDPNNQLYVHDWFPLHGDKIVYTPDGLPGYRVGTVAFDDNVISTVQGRVQLIDEALREAFVIHCVGRKDGWFSRPHEAANVFGVGLREKVYWLWLLKQEALASLQEAVERFGVGGLLIGRFQAGNPESQQIVLDALTKLRANGYVAALPSIPKDEGEGFEVIAPQGAGLQQVYDLVEKWDQQIRLVITHQLGTAEAVSTGLGSSIGDAHQNTFDRLIKYDACSLAETISKDLVKILVKYNFPEYQDLDFRFRFVTDTEDIGERLELAKQLQELGVSLNLDELRELAGFSAPENDDQKLNREEVI